MMSATFSRLVWKDALLVKTLMMLVAFAILVVNVAIVISSWMNPAGFSDGEAAMVFWTLIPNLVAFGVPALLIGTEEESGTLAWLRTLPIPRWNVIYSKLLVAILAVAITWALSSIALISVSFLDGRLDVVTRPGDWEVSGMLMTGYFSVLLLFIGFVTSYAFRSPIAALLVVLPFTMLSLFAYFYVFNSGSLRIWHDSGRVPAIVAIVYLVLLVILQHRLALRRLRPAYGAASERAGGYSLLSAVQVSAERHPADYRLNLQLRLPIPRLVRAATKQDLLRQPTPTRALLWQAASQQAVPAIVLLLLSVGLMWRWPTWDRGLLAIGAVVAMCWLGSLTFYSDTLRRRHHYFAERGISRSSVWLTRMALPVAAVLVIAVANAWVHRYHIDRLDAYIPLVFGVVGFAIGSLMSMAAARPVLGLIVSPVLLAVVLTLLGSTLGHYVDYWPAIVLVAIPILFATWRLLPRWSLGRRGIGFDARVVAYIMLGMLLVCIYVLGHRWSTIPAEMPQWRAEMTAVEVNLRESEDEERWNLEDYQAAQQDFGLVTQMIRLNQNNDSRIHLLGAAQDLLEEIRRAREAIAEGQADASMLITVERDEEEVLAGFAGMHNFLLARPNLQDTLAPDALRRQSRRVALLGEWQNYQQQSWRDHKLPGSPYGPKLFLGRRVAARHASYSFERLRADRFVDAATKATLEYLEREPSEASEAEIERLKWLWRNVFDYPSAAGEQALPISLEADRLIVELRTRVAAS